MTWIHGRRSKKSLEGQTNGFCVGFVSNRDSDADTG